MMPNKAISRCLSARAWLLWIAILTGWRFLSRLRCPEQTGGGAAVRASVGTRVRFDVRVPCMSPGFTLAANAGQQQRGGLEAMVLWLVCLEGS